MSDTWEILDDSEEKTAGNNAPAVKNGLGDLFSGELPEEDLSEDELEDKIGLSLSSEIPDPGWDDLTRQLIKASCAFTAQELLMGPPEAPYNGKFLIGDHHMEWDELISKHKRLCILAARNHGKCGIYEDLLTKSDGTPVMLGKWNGGDLIAWDEKSLGFVKTYAPASKPNGIKPVYRIKTRTGRELTVTEEHPLRRLDGWTKAEDLKVGNKLASVRKMPNIGKDYIQKLLDSPVFWDEISEIEKLPPVETWALSVPGFHTYVANGIVNHNTFFVDFAYPIWQAINNPRQSGFIFSSTQDQAERILGDIREEIENNPKLQWLVPKIKEKWGSRLIRCSNGHRIYARGFGTKVRGAHPAYIVVDDGLTDETQYSEMICRKQKDYFYAAITNMINPGGQIVVIGTPLSSDDLYADLKKNPEYHYCEYPAESHPGYPDNKALWPERFSLEDLARRRREIGEIMYTREFLVSPISDNMSLFPMFLFQGQTVERFNIRLGMPSEFWREVGVAIYMGVDFAISSSVGADYTVVFVMGKDDHGNRWIIDIQREKGLPYQQQLSLINAVARKYSPELVALESNQMQRIFGDELIRTSDLPIWKFTTGVQKHTLDKGVPSLRVLLENGKFRIPRGDAHSVEMTDLMSSEFRSFTYIDGKLTSTGGHDDIAMACYICEQAVRRGGFSFSFGDEENLGHESMEELMKEMTGVEEESKELGVDKEPILKDKVEIHPAIKNGLVPHGCTQDLSSVMSCVIDGEDPCSGCDEDRSVCKGRGGLGRSILV